uniref:NFACT RNA-binding domain-containing protein n=2 Tax=Geminigeraceae TaxID=589343 RepID=A0A0C3U817_GUITC
MLGARLANIYDLDAKTYLLKTNKVRHALAGGAWLLSPWMTERFPLQSGEKCLVLLESGIRFHTTEFMRDKSNMPSGFTLKLRKHIRMKRIEEVKQLGVDRVVIFTFGAADEAFHLILELFAGGNIILVDHQYTILALLRTYTDEATNTKVAVKETYQLDSNQNENRKISVDLLMEAFGKGAKNEKATMRDVLIKELDYGPALVEHALLGTSLDGKMKVSEMEITRDSPVVSTLFGVFKEVDDMIANLTDGGKMIEGVLVRKGAGEDSPYDDFGPVVLRQYAGKKLDMFDSFDKAMDAYFSIAEDKKLEQQKVQQKKAAVSKVERVKRAHEASIQALQEEEAENYHRATLIEANLSDVDNAILVINSMLSQGMDWASLKKLVKEEGRKGNPIAQMIHGLKLDSNQITLLLTFGLDAMEEEEQTLPVVAVDVDLGMNAYQNAQSYYSSKKKVALKAEKTMQAAGKAIKGAERKAKEDLKKADTKASIQQIRKTHWFEKFIWFISSENFLVLCGRDAQQNELLVKRHMEKGDIYLHADIHGAATHIIKNHTKDAVPPLTLAQAGLSCVCRSQAWDAKMVTSAYWVHPEQVSKSAPTGEYLSTGSFMIRGKKNYLPPNSLIMGFGLLFRIDESCLAHHVGERKIRGLGEQEEEMGKAGDSDEIPEEEEEEEEEGEEEGEETKEKDGGKKDSDARQSKGEMAEMRAGR